MDQFKSILEDRKLILIVDLDETILQSVVYPCKIAVKDIHHFVSLGPYHFHTKFRPGFNTFFKNLENIFQFHICTTGTRLYATKIIEYLDPQKTLFSDRIVTREQLGKSNKAEYFKKNIFMEGDNLVCMIDDKEVMWNNAPNLITVKPYKFFSNLTGSSKSQQVSAKLLMKEDDDDYLATLEKILKNIHLKFYEDFDRRKSTTGELPHVQETMIEIQKNILQNCCVTIDINSNLNSENIRIAQKLGATIDFQAAIIDPPTNDYDKILNEDYLPDQDFPDKAENKEESTKEPPCQIKLSEWLQECYFNWEKYENNQLLQA